MQIVLFNNNQNNINFTARLPQKVFKEVKDIPGMCCAKCRNKMLSSPELDTFMGKLAVDSRTTMKTHVDGNIENKSVVQFLKSLSEQYPRTSFYEIAKKPEVKKRIAKELSDKDRNFVQSIMEFSSVDLKRAPIVVNKLKALKEKFPQMPQVYCDVIDYLDFYATKHPDKTIGEILTIPGVIARHRKASNFYYERFLTTYDKEFKALEKLGDKLSEEDRIRFDKLNKHASVTWNAIYLPSETKTMHLEEVYGPFLKHLEDRKLAAKIEKQIAKVPHNNLDVDYLLYKFSKLQMTEKDYIKEIVDQVASTFEHIKADSMGGKRTKGNGLYLCKACNNSRSNLSYTTVLRHWADFGENIKAQVRKIVSLVKHGNLPEYEDSILRIKQALNRETRGQVVIDLKDFFEFKKAKVSKIVDSTKEKLTENGKKILEKTQQINDSKHEIEELNKRIQQLKHGVAQLEKEKGRAYNVQHILQDELKGAKKDLNKVLNEINEDNNLKQFSGGEG